MTWTNATLLLIGPSGTTFNEIQNGNTELFIHENAFENVVCEVAAILSRGSWVKLVKLFPVIKLIVA